MKTICRSVLPLGLVLACSFALAEESHNPCPSELVNFWINYAADTENYSAIPAFLLKNECLRSLESTEFHNAMVNRLDHPENEKYVADLYAQLNWDKKIAKQ